MGDTLLALWVLASASAIDLEVGGAGYATLADALADANAGDRLLLHGPGWSGSYVVPMDLTFEAWPGDTVVLTADNSVGGNPSGDGFFGVVGVDVTLRDVTLDGGGAYRVARVSSGGSLTLERVEVTGGLATNNLGGAVIVRDAGSSLTLVDCHVHDNVATGASASGGAVAVDASATLAASGTWFEANAAGADGGALWCRGACDVADSVFSANSAGSDGGAVMFLDSPGAVLTGSRFCGNLATDGGGALRFTVPPAEVSSNVFWGNHAANGGAIQTSVNLILSQTDFLQNTTDGEGAAIEATSGATLAGNSIVVDHTSPGGSAFHGDVTLQSVLYNGNTMALFGGAATDAGTVLNAPARFSGYDPADCEGSVLTLLPASVALGAGDPIWGDDLGAFGVACVPEIAGDGIDQDCDGVDTCYVDADGDGYGGTATAPGSDLTCGFAGESTTGDDCNDSSVAFHPGATEVCNTLDDDCDGAVDDEDPDVDLSGVPSVYVDDDDDGYGVGDPIRACDPPQPNAPVAGDCDDDEPFSNPGAPEQCDNGVDDDCDGTVDEQSAPVDWYLDADGDGHGDPATVVEDCARPSPDHVLDGDDCDDTEPDVFPGAVEACDGIDNDCDTVVDPGCGDDASWPEWTDAVPLHGCTCASSAPRSPLGVALGALARRR